VVVAAALTRAELSSLTSECLRAGRYWQPDLWLVQWRGRPYVVKDYRSRPPLYRWSIGLLATRRESKNYQRLAGLPGIPAFGGRIDRFALAVEYIPGRNADRFKKGELPAAFFSELRAVIQGVHDRGVVLGDLRNSKNIMVTEQGRPMLIDFSTGFGRGGWWNPLQRWLFRIFERDDFLGVAKLKRRYAPELMTDDERRGLAEGLPFERPAHALRDAFKHLVKRLAGPGKKKKRQD
jgi:hypothetical protein